ncbi:FG-GAP repeat domain-containing protein [Planctomyces sp. SH-PL14]|uniref:FG-GAP repeat domain-containing protein n=1 Tax=Planctomyces sp. SH-PL14 TaxID=1632864 RepID=UPI00078D41F2|nr:VCBS repeat-containing protein [Planctomyces sp. SH-PL14]AMV19503.1 FG-GAP repeat protein [Planctomyces sp. SH-PL14]
MRSLSSAASLALSLISASALAAPPAFKTVEIEKDFCKVACYAVALADVDGDNKQDIVAVTENRVLWYQAPDWKPHLVIEDQTERDNVCIAPYDIDGDGQVDFALGAGWTKIGTIQWLSRGKTLDEKWSVHPIGREGWTHRMRFANVLGKDKAQLVVSPLNATTIPTGVRLTAFEIPANPKTDPWPHVVLDDTLNRMHNHWHLDRNGDKIDATLTASQEGLHLLRKTDTGFSKRKVGSGAEGAKPEERGSGEVKIGQLKGGRPFMATIEPMHGNQVVIYTAPPELPEGQLATRIVLDDTFKQGHGVFAADLDGDGDDEVIAGYREPGTGTIKGPGVFIYEADDEAGTKWTKHVLDDGGMAVEDLMCADVTGDGKIDIIAGGRATKNLKLYVNQGVR